MQPTKQSDLAKLFAAFFGTGIVVVILACWVWNATYTDDTYFYADNNAPMIIAADGFYYLSAATNYLTLNVKAPPLSQLAALCHMVSGVSLMHIVFWLPMCFAFLHFILYFFWGKILNLSFLQIFFAASIGSSIPAWLKRSSIGWFDTDQVISLLWNLCIICTALLIFSKNNVSHAKKNDCHNIQFFKTICFPLSGLILSGILLGWWWRPGSLLLPFCLFIWGITFFWAKTRIEYNIRLSVLGVSLLTAISFIICGYFFSISITSYYDYLLKHFQLLLGTTNDVIIHSISELHVLPLNITLQNLGGHWIGGILMLFVACCFIVRLRRMWIIFLPALVALTWGFAAERFIYLAALFLGLSAATFGQNIVFLFMKRKVHQKYTIILQGGIIITLLFCIGQWVCQWKPTGYFTKYHDAVAVALRNESSPRSFVWNWWDDGYFLRARANLTPLFDGGSQEKLRAYITSRPFMVENTDFARRWIRFFSIRGIEAMQPLIKHYKDPNIAWQTLEQIFLAKNSSVKLQTLPQKLQTWIFPEGKVYLYFSQRILRLSQWWGPLGLTLHPRKEDIRPFVNVFAKEDFYYNEQTKKLFLPLAVREKGYAGVNAVYNTQYKPLHPPFPEKDGVFAIVSPYSDWLYLVNRKGLSSLPIRLLAPGGVILDGFRPIATDYNFAGAWEVLP